MGDPKIKGGYILLSRLIFESPIWFEEPNILRVFIWMIGKARYKREPKRFSHFDVNRGELVTSLAHIADDNEYMWHGKLQKISRTKISRIINKLSEHKYIEVLSDTYGTHLKVCNYDTYQDPSLYKSDDDETEVKRKCNGSETQVDTYNNDNNVNNEEINEVITKSSRFAR